MRTGPITTSHRPGRHRLLSALAIGIVAVLAACEPVRPWPVPGPDGSCRTEWGSIATTVPGLSPSPVDGLRTGSHECFDRIVIDLDGPIAPGWSVAYVDRLREPGRGDGVPLRGGAELRVIVRSPAYEPTRQVTYDPPVPDELADVSGYPTLRQVAYAGSFEGQSTFGVGVRARLPYRVLALDGPGGGSRVVIDVAHRWS